MHTLHWIAIDDMSAEKAEKTVIARLEEWEGGWWDWFDTTIGGRWSSNSKTVCVTDTKAYDEVISRIKSKRREEMKRLVDVMDFSKFSSAIEEYEGNDHEEEGNNLYYIGKAVDLLTGDWNYNSYFYDSESYSTNLKDFQERVSTNPTEQFLVPIDFHF
jgi:hypothetical protein